MIIQPNIPLQQQKKPSYAAVIIITVIVSFIISGLVGFTTSGLGQALYQKYIKKEMPYESPKQALKVEEESATIDVVKKVQPAVVSIVVTQDLKKLYEQYQMPYESPFGDDFFKEFFGEQGDQSQNDQNQEGGQQKISGGSGFIIRNDGLILTNSHVVSFDNVEYTVILNDGKKYPAKVLASDSISDVALVKIEAKDLPTTELGNSDSLQIGQTVIAIGYALGEYPNTVTKGVISGLGRNITAGGSYVGYQTLENVIQTDAAINPGNSGGPLLNLAGQVIGLNTAVDAGGQLLGFATPINSAKADIESVERTGKISRPFLGVRYQLVNSEIAKKNNLPYEYGVLVLRGENKDELAVVPGSPADKAGIVENDLILELNGQKIDEKNTLAKLISKQKVEDEVTLKIWHKGQEKTVKVKLEEKK
ncbi:MAG: trypsin-like peptidase domain-containing protein [Patescibacteria group bacterium]